MDAPHSGGSVGGGGGLIGSYMVPLLVAWGARVTVVDDYSSGEPDLLAGVATDINLIVGDLRDRRACEAWLHGHDVFINLAARASGACGMLRMRSRRMRRGSTSSTSNSMPE